MVSVRGKDWTVCLCTENETGEVVVCDTILMRPLEDVMTTIEPSVMYLEEDMGEVKMMLQCVRAVPEESQGSSSAG